MVPDAAVHELNTVLATGIPVFVVAYFAARATPDNFADRDEPPILKVPTAWQVGWRRWLIDRTDPKWTQKNLDRPGQDIEMNPDFQTRSDRNVAVIAPPGLMASLFAIALAETVAGRWLTAASMILFGLLVGTVLVSTTQVTMLRLQLSKQGTNSCDPFGRIVMAWGAGIATNLLAVILAALLLLP